MAETFAVIVTLAKVACETIVVVAAIEYLKSRGRW